MRQILFAAVLTLGTLIFQNIGAIASQSNQTPEDGIVVGIKPGKVPPVKPKQVIGDDITAYYQNGILTLNINADLGYADVEVINTSTGDSWSDSISGYGSTSIYLSGNNGIYLIYINTELGTYSGKFEL